MSKVTVEADVAKVAREALRTLPRGHVWNRHADSNMSAFWSALGTVIADVTNRGQDLIAESDTRTLEELIPGWEDYLGLPEPDCTTNPGTALLRRYAAFAKHTAQGGQSRQFFIDLAAAIGFAITIEEFTPYVVGESVIGEKLYTDPWSFVWRVHAPVHTVTFARAGKHRAGEPIAYSDNSLLECTLSIAKPSHTNVVFSYDLPYVGYAPWKRIFPDTTVLELVLDPLVIGGTT